MVVSSKDKVCENVKSHGDQTKTEAQEETSHGKVIFEVADFSQHLLEVDCCPCCSIFTNLLFFFFCDILHFVAICFPVHSFIPIAFTDA